MKVSVTDSEFGTLTWEVPTSLVVELVVSEVNTEHQRAYYQAIFGPVLEELGKLFWHAAYVGSGAPQLSARALEHIYRQITGARAELERRARDIG